MTRILAIIFFAAALGTVALARDTITLRPQAESARTLEDIAILEGPIAAQLAETPIEPAVESAPGARVVTLESLRRLLEKQDKINWGRITLSGSRCILREPASRDPGGTPAPAADQSSPASPSEVTPTPSPMTVRTLIIARIAGVLRSDPADVKLDFEERDRVTLDTPVDGRTADIQLLGSSDRQSISVKLFDGLSIVLQDSVRTGITIRRTVAVASGPISRGDSLSSQTFTIEERWIPPSIRPAPTDTLDGKSARTAIRAGEVIEETDTEQPLVIKKGDLVDVHCLSGSIRLQIVARALESARLGESLRLLAPDSKRPFTARAEGPHLAVTGVSDVPEAAKAPPSPRSLPTADPRRTRTIGKTATNFAKLANQQLPTSDAQPTLAPPRRTNSR